MLLRELVEVNEKGNVTNDVNFDMMDNPETNQNLCDSFIFNYDPKKPELSTVGILDRIKESYHSRNQPNVHMLIQQYGRGKSHFAVVLANFFGKSADSPEVQGILDQVSKATSGSSRVIAEKIKSYKQRQQKPHLVLCLRGDKGGDIRKQFLQVVVAQLKSAGVDNAIATHMCREPLNYLEGLSPENKAKAETYLASLGNPDGNLISLIKELKKNNSSVIRTVKDICRHVSNVAPDFQDNIDIEAILRDLLDNLCSGENAPFNGILILFDEMRQYLESWAVDQIGAGGPALQNITNICALADYKGKIALLSFTQIHPSRAGRIAPSAQESYGQITTRLAPSESTYDGPASSLELVIENMLTQKEESQPWENFLYRWNDTLLSSARDAFEKRIEGYSKRGWSLDYFYDHCSKGCFPLHPITVYLLCNLSFTQDRTAIQFIKKYVKNFIEETPVEDVGERLNYIYPIELFDFFRDNFGSERDYKRYEEVERILGSNNPDELKALKALLLYSVSSNRLIKGDHENHEEILGSLAGLSESRMRTVLHSLFKDRDLICYKPEHRLYSFWEGISPGPIDEIIEDLIRDKGAHLQSVVEHCQASCESLLRNSVYVARQFIDDRKLVADDWQYQIKFYTPDGLIHALSNEQIMKGTTEKGIFAYVIAETQEELQDLRRTISDYLAASPSKNSIAVAIPSEATGDLARLLLKRKTLDAIEAQQKRMWGIAACEQLNQRWSEQLHTRLRQILKSCSFHSIALNKVPLDKQNQPEWVASTLLKELYSFVPPVENQDKLRSNHRVGQQIVAVVASQLIADKLSPQTLPRQNFYKSVIEAVYVNSWKLLRQTPNKYIPQEPKEENLKAAWSEINRFTELNGQPEKHFSLVDLWNLLSKPPYGYNEYNFTVLFAAWLACHRKDVALYGPVSIQRPQNGVSRKQQLLREWANTDVFQNPKAFVNSWIIRDKSKLVCREGFTLPELPNSPMDLNQAQEYLNKASDFLESTEADSDELASIQRTSEKVTAALEPITTWFQPVELTEALLDDAKIEMLLDLYQQLKRPLPSYSLNSDVISVRPTADQRSRHDAASQAIATRIEQYTEQVSLRSEALETTEVCSTYQADLQNLIDLFQQMPELPKYLGETLKNALKVAERVRDNLNESVRIRKLLETAQSTARVLNDYSSQADFVRVVAEIEAIGKNISSEKSESDEIQRLLQGIERQYQELNQKLDAWEERLTSATTQSQIVALLQETAKHRDRFTDPSSRERLNRLNDSLNCELAGIESKSQTETLLKAELDNARQHLQRLRDLPDARIVEAFQAYQELKGFQFTPVEDTELLGTYQERLKGFKIQGYEQITHRFQQVCDRKLSRIDLYENRKDSLERAIAALDGAEDFEVVRANLTQSLIELESQAETLRQQIENQRKGAEDKQTIKEIQQLRPNQSSSIHTCEESLARIQALQAKLHFTEQFQTEIDQVIKACQDKIQVHKQSLDTLRDQLATVNNSEILNRLQLSHARLEAAFKDSSEADAYQVIGATIDDIKDDLETLGKLENRYSRSDSIVACKEILEDLAQSQDLLKHPERFRENRLNRLEEQTREKIQTYQRDLAQIEQQLIYASTHAEIRKLQQTLLKKSSCYVNSDESERVDALTAEIEALVRLMPLLEIAKAANLETCNQQVEHLISWQNSSEDMSQGIRDRITAALEELEKRRQKLLIEKQEHARSWLRSLNDKSSQMLNAVRESKKYDLASEILKSIHDFKDKHTNFLNTAEQKNLLEIEHQCLDEQNKHSGNQIITMFRQLPPSQRQALYQHLEIYLVDQDESNTTGKAEED